MEYQNQSYGHNGVLDLDDLNLQNEIQNPVAAQDLASLYEVETRAQGSGDDEFDLDDDPSLDDDDTLDDDDLITDPDAPDDDEIILDEDDELADEDDDDDDLSL